jgi:hypothetical protein
MSKLYVSYALPWKLIFDNIMHFVVQNRYACWFALPIGLRSWNRNHGGQDYPVISTA